MIPVPKFAIVTIPVSAGRKVSFALLLLIHGIVTSTSAVGQSSTSLLRLSNATLPPVTTSDRDGYLDKLYEEWFERAGLQVQLFNTPAARGLENANSGIVSGDAARIDIDNSLYPNLLRVPEPVIEVIFSGLYTDPEVNVRSQADYRKYRVGYVRGWRIAERLFEGEANAIAVRTSDNLLDMLAVDRLEIAFMTVAPARELARKKKMKFLNRTDFVIRKNLYLHLHSSHGDKVPRMTEILREMKSDGSYDRIMSGYVVENR